MGLTPARRAVAVLLGAHAFIALIVLALQALPRTLTPVSRACGDSPAPGLCALLHGQARAAGRAGPNEGRLSAYGFSKRPPLPLEGGKSTAAGDDWRVSTRRQEPPPLPAATPRGCAWWPQ